MRERRRRMLTDDADRAPAVPTVRLPGAGSPAETYTEAGRRARQTPISSLFPVRKLSISLVACVALLAVAGCLGLHVVADYLVPVVGSQATAGLRIDSPASLTRWLGSTLLGLAAATAVFVYSLRKHRIDDYHARYRVWLTMALVCLAVSVIESTSLNELAHELARKACAAATLRFDIVWPAALASVVTLCGIRLAFEIRRCGPALTMLLLTMVTFVGAAAVEYQWPVEVSQAGQPLWLRGCWLSGYVMVLITFLVYGRHVQFEIAGNAALGIKPKRKKASAAETPAPQSTKKAIKVRTDLDPVEVSEPARSAEAKPAAVSIPIDEQAGQRPSRAERKKLRHEQRKAS